MVELVYTPVEQIEQIRTDLRNGFNSKSLQNLAYRKSQVLQLVYLVQDNTQAFLDALKTDLNRPETESHLGDINNTIVNILKTYHSLEAWAAPEKAPFNYQFAAMSPTIRKEPKGTVLVISPFNYPVWLSLGPVAGAIAAGNTVLLKPSELTSAVSQLLADLVPKYIDADVFRVVNGAIPETSKILELQWDHTGQHVGKYSFDTFTHLRSTLDSPGWVDKLIGGRYPPYTAKKLKTLNALQLPSLPARPVKGAAFKPNRADGYGFSAKWTLVLAVAVAAVLVNSNLSANFKGVLPYLPGWVQSHLRI
ncbi:ALDH-like protein [Athelia psychrophila]|uniref:ALDH-like protein n=1 Tax=Athelia psychrophila TaxID=1759441 RepID=A0A165XL63_9AGAM|nr:ALDH-like protein [Fibularhizoctonia sp. CBS 109695]